MTRALARLGGIERRFGSVIALAGADLELRSGEVHGVLGANGAGKSTLFNVLGGMLRPDAGVIEVEGESVEFTTPRDAWVRGIGLVHQHFTLVPALTVAENLALGMRDVVHGGRSIRSEAEAIMDRTGLHVSLRPRVETLGVGARQRIEILKALLRDPRVLVLDEPTAALTPNEIEGLFGLLRELAAEGRAVAIVAHKLDEVMGVADRVTVLRSGRTVLTARPAEHDMATFVRAMVGDDVVDPIALGLGAAGWTGAAPFDGRDASAAVAAESQAAGFSPVDAEPGHAAEPGDGLAADAPADVVVRLSSVRVEGEGGARLVDADLEVRRGEVVGIAGVEGNGQRELARVLAGRSIPSRGTAVLPPGIGFIPQDRSTEGLVADFDLTENVALALHEDRTFQKGPWLRWDRLAGAAEEVRTGHDIAAPSVATPARALSGGNQQRLVVGRELRMSADLLVAESPTRGLDIAASAFVHDELRRLASKGVAIVLVSTDLDEILALSDRVYAIARGLLTPVPDSRRTREGIGSLMLGGGASHG